MSITVSVLTVTYNSSETIKECLSSPDNQTFKNFESYVTEFYYFGLKHKKMKIYPRAKSKWVKTVT